MRAKPILPMLLAALPALPALAAPPSVVVDTAPLHSLVARVMGNVASPDLLLPPGASPHDMALRPSDAARLDAAGMVIWVGPELTPWLEAPLERLAPEAVRLEMLRSPGWTALPRRETAGFETEVAHDEHDDHDDHDHDHGDGIDPHAWLDPDVAAAWMGNVAEALAEADPDNAETYRGNAAAAAEDAAQAEAIAARLAPLQGHGYLVPHDAYQYFERRFALPARGAVALSDAAAPGPARIAELRAMLEDQRIDCVLTDPQTSAEWSDLLREGNAARSAMADPDGTMLTPGPGLYPELIDGLAAALQDCLG